MDIDPTILVIDDDAEMATALADLLYRQGYTVQAVTSAEEAAEAVSRWPRLGLLFMDLVMPGVDGLTLLESLKQQRPELAVVMMSGLGTLASAVEAVKRGADDYITKPFERTTVLRKVQHLLELRSLREKVAKLESARRHTDRMADGEHQADEFPLLPLERLEKYAIEQALRFSGNNKSRARKILGISRQSLYRKMRLHGIPL